MTRQRSEVRSQRSESRGRSASLQLLTSDLRLLTSAFTLIELVSVLAIVAVLLTMVLGAYAGWGRATSIDGAAGILAAGLGHARELAITQRVDTRVAWRNVARPGRPPHGVFDISSLGENTNEVPVVCTPSNALPADVRFRGDVEAAIEFRPDGTCAGSDLFGTDGCAVLVLDNVSGRHVLTRVVEVNRFSGRIRVRREDEP